MPSGSSPKVWIYCVGIWTLFGSGEDVSSLPILEALKWKRTHFSRTFYYSAVITTWSYEFAFPSLRLNIVSESKRAVRLWEKGRKDMWEKRERERVRVREREKIDSACPRFFFLVILFDLTSVKYKKKRHFQKVGQNSFFPQNLDHPSGRPRC